MKLLSAQNVLIGKDLDNYPKAIIQIDNGLIDKIYKSIDHVDPKLHKYIVNYPTGTIMPGLIDSHSHLALDTRIENHLNKMSDPKNIQMDRALNTLEDDLKSGVTTTRTLGDKHYIDIYFSDLQRKKEILAPRIVPSGIGMRSISGHGYVGVGFKDVSEFIAQSKVNINKGAKVLKLFATGVIRSTPDIPTTLSSEIITSVVKLGQSMGVPTTIHASGGAAIDYALDANIHSIEHIYYISPTQIERMLELSTWAVLTPSYGMDKTLLEKFSTLDWEDTLRESHDIQKSLSSAVEMGVNYAIGTDGNHGSLYKEAQYISQLGDTNLNILKALTINGAKLSGIDHLTGSLKEGLSADIIVTDGSPLDDISSLKDPLAVYLQGQLI